MTQFNPRRFALARRRRARTKRKLALEIGVTERSVRAFENGGSAPSADTLQRIAAALHFPVGFFLAEGDVSEIASDGASFRALTSMTARQRDAVLAAASLAFELNRLLEERFNLPDVDVPDLREHTPEGAARALRERWGLGEKPISNIIHLVESKGVRVFSLDREYANVDAFTTWQEGRPFMFLNTMKTAERSRFDAAHELGHAVLHRHGEPRGRSIEAEANGFASAFLVPESQAIALAPRAPTIARLARRKMPWGVSVAALARRLHDLKLMTDWHYRQVCIELSKRGGVNEPNPMQRETSSLLRQVFRSLRETGTSSGQIARELHIGLSDLNGLVFGLVPTAVAGRTGGSRKSSNDKPKLRLI